jgi:hypothetical protein
MKIRGWSYTAPPLLESVTALLKKEEKMKEIRCKVVYEENSSMWLNKLLNTWPKYDWTFAHKTTVRPDPFQVSLQFFLTVKVPYRKEKWAACMCETGSGIWRGISLVQAPGPLQSGPAIAESYRQGVTKRCRLSWLTNSALVYEPQMRGGGGSCGVLMRGAV